MWRLIHDAPADGYRNMAVDEALLDACAAGEPGFPCLRLYAFRPPCLSLGFSQEHAASVDLDVCRENGIDVVRRPTGGLAVLHDDEVTYAVVARLGEGPFGGSVVGLYESVAGALLAGFAKLGIEAAVTCGDPRPASRGGPVCFAEPSRHEIAAGTSKIAGSALARRRGAFLQHGSIPLTLDMDLLHRAARGGEPAGGPSGLAAAAGRNLAAPAVEAALRSGFEEKLGASFAEQTLSSAEHVSSERLRAFRYLSSDWTLRR